MVAFATERYCLPEILANRCWIQRQSPFPHTVATDVFDLDFYRALEFQFKAIQNRSFGHSGDGFAQKFAHYDAYAYALPPDVAGPLRLFASAEWHNLLAKVANVRAIGRVNVTLHHHAAGSANGRVHNDLNPGWFYDYSARDGIMLPSHRLCNYRHGFGPGAPSRKKEFVRSAALLFYVCNPGWRAGDGGETGLYWSNNDPVDQPAMAVPPLDNSLLLFACTPYSYHSFLTNTRTIRNVVVMWLHCEKRDVVQRWGEHSIVYWPTVRCSNRVAGARSRLGLE